MRNQPFIHSCKKSVFSLFRCFKWKLFIRSFRQNYYTTESTFLCSTRCIMKCCRIQFYTGSCRNKKCFYLGCIIDIAIFNILLQVLEEGRLTDSQGKTVDFRNTVIIMTSNVGAREIAQDASVGFGTTGEQGLTSSEIRGRAMGELKRLFRPELLNRIDDIVVFQKLSGENLTKIAHLLVDDLRQRLIANGMNIKLTDAAYDKIVAEGTDLTNGARPLRRAIQKLIEDPLSEELLAGEWGEGDTVLCDVADGKFVFSRGTGEIPAPRPAGTLGGDTAPAVPHTGNAAPVSGGVTSGPGGMMQAGSGAL